MVNTESGISLYHGETYTNVEPQSFTSNGHVVPFPIS